MVKNLLTNEIDWEEKLRDQWKYPNPVEKLMSLKKIMLLVKNLLT